MMILKYFALMLVAVVANCKLEQVVSMIRHGARYSINSIYDGAFDKSLQGELTAVGMRQHENLGKLLRKDYIDGLGFLTNQYTDKSIEAYSTDLNRTMQSIISLLYGLYPLGYGPKKLNVPKQYNIPPFSMDQDTSQDFYALPKGYLPFIVKINSSVLIGKCENKKNLEKSNINRQKIIQNQMRQNYLPFFQKMSQIFNISPSFSQISSLDQTVTTDKNLGRPLPVAFTKKDELNLKHLHYWYKYFRLNNSTIQQAINTGKIKRIISDFDGRINNPKQQLKWTFLSIHDTDISAILPVLNVTSPQCIEQLYTTGKISALNCSPNQEYGSSIIFELHSHKDEYFIKIRHDGIYVNLCQQKNTSCLYEEWKSRVIVNLNDVDLVCKGRKKQSQKVIIALQL